MKNDRPVSVPSSSPAHEDERALLIRLELLLEREEGLIVASDAPGLLAISEERERVTERLGAAARARCSGPAIDAEDEAELVALYKRLRQRHDVQAQIVRRHVDRTTRAMNVLSQATGRSGLYRADGRVAMQFLSA